MDLLACERPNGLRLEHWRAPVGWVETTTAGPCRRPPSGIRELIVHQAARRVFSSLAGFRAPGDFSSFLSVGDAIFWKYGNMIFALMPSFFLMSHRLTPPPSH